MARTDKLYDNPRSKLMTGAVAAKGDVRKGKEIGSDPDDETEYESTGAEMSDDDRRDENNRATGTPDKVEYWKRKKKAERPMS